VTDLPTGLPAGTVLEVLYAEQGATAPEVGDGGKLTGVLPARAILVARATSTVVTPTPPGATITVDTPIAGQVFSDDVTISGHVTPATARFRMVVDGQYDVITGVPVAADGSWSIVLPVSGFPVGRQDHTLAFYSPPTKASTPTWRFTSDVVFDPVVTTVTDPVGDDRGPIGTYTYPTDSTFGHQQDLVQVKIEAASTTMRLSLTMADWSTTWNPDNGFDHVAFNVYFEVPGQPGATVLPLLDAPAPAGFAWRYDQTTFGFGNTMYRSDGATASTPGAVDKAPKVSVDAATRTVIFTYNRNDYGLAAWSGVRLYVTTWDIDGIQNVYRALGPTATAWTYGGGAAGDPRIMDDAGPILIP
jgi:hypothetical protein